MNSLSLSSSASPFVFARMRHLDTLWRPKIKKNKENANALFVCDSAEKHIEKKQFQNLQAKLDACNYYHQCFANIYRIDMPTMLCKKKLAARDIQLFVASSRPNPMLVFIERWSPINIIYEAFWALLSLLLRLRSSTAVLSWKLQRNAKKGGERMKNTASKPSKANCDI